MKQQVEKQGRESRLLAQSILHRRRSSFHPLIWRNALYITIVRSLCEQQIVLWSERPDKRVWRRGRGNRSELVSCEKSTLATIIFEVEMPSAYG